jgi:two-component system, chemotaxis family, CheB/CheR fusion protein
MKQPEQQPLDEETSTKLAAPQESSEGFFRIVGIGASAGGLEALEEFLGNVKADSGMAYVVIQHLDPTQKGMLPELLQRACKLKVAQVRDGMVVKPNHVYVIPPNRSMSILDGTLQLFKPIEPRGLRLPIDFFLRSLAEDQKELSIGLILSGMGSDGSLGLAAIKERNGLVMVQEPTSAKFDSMPRSAIEAVMADIIAPSAELPDKLKAFLSYIPMVQLSPDMETKDKSALERIIIILRNHTGNDFTLYKKSTIYRRIERRMVVHKIDRIAAYVHFLQDNPREVEILFKELLIGVTNFFRDSEMWSKLEKEIIPGILAQLPTGTNLRAWVPACSTGEEAYSLAIAFKEAVEQFKPPKNLTLQIFATDLDNEAIEIARRGLFPVNILGDVPSERITKYFVKSDEGYRITSSIREMVVFAQHNLVMHPPFTKLEFISCRNLLIYMEHELQKKILEIFYFSLNREGIMVLGSSETSGAMAHLFGTIDARLKIYKRSEDANPTKLLNFPSSFAHLAPEHTEKQAPDVSASNIQALADQLLLQQFAPAGVLVNDQGDILYISGRTGKYLEPAAGKANLNVFVMLREGLRNDFHLAFHQAIRKKETVELRNLKVGTNGSTQTLHMSIQYIEKPEALRGSLMIVFTDVPGHPEPIPAAKRTRKVAGSAREAELENTLLNVREEMQNTIEEMQASQEELKSANEELQSANEELQSTNEELTSSKEEMQSLNEEMQTLNAELQSKVDDFSRVSNDMKNLLNSTDIATLFLDNDLNIRRYTNEATKIFKFIKSDIGRPFTDQVSDLIYPEMAEDAREVLRTLIFIQKQIPGKDGRWFSVRLMPYRTYDDRIDGLVITFINISDLKLAEDQYHASMQLQTLLLNASAKIIIKLSNDLLINEFNPAAEIFFGRKHAEIMDTPFQKLLTTKPLQKKTFSTLKQMLTDGSGGKLSLQMVAKDEHPIDVVWKAQVLLNNDSKVSGMLMMAESSTLGKRTNKNKPK